jgi:hypothetical protein
LLLEAAGQTVNVAALLDSVVGRIPGISLVGVDTAHVLWAHLVGVEASSFVELGSVMLFESVLTLHLVRMLDKVVHQLVLG